jgi:hypothetical protein
MRLRDLVRKLETREHLKRVSHSHTFHTTNELAHLAYLVSIMVEKGGIHTVTGGVMLVCSVVVLLGGEV